MCNSEAFLKSFSAIEKHLRFRTGLDRYTTFSDLVNKASNTMPEVKKAKTRDTSRISRRGITGGDRKPGSVRTQ